jgi:hypothetical protein
MFKVEGVDWGYYRVTGYADGSDWLVAPGRTTIHAHGIAADDRVWFYDDRAELHIFRAPSRTSVATLTIGSPEKYGNDTRISASRDGRRLYALVSQEEQQVLHIVDPTLGKVVGTQHGFPGGWLHAPLERHDGKILIPLQSRSTGSPKQYGLVLFDP